ncbi:hypothetical protein J3R30DRAFT_188204 [Lentinula aciculospora]|uniref:Uncharacterized protein n=1 Tax=Lentinula aciculospora TaxID=153920 RepID=A0A9W9A8V7_9AGAR|nr:hypothetical protein J3R30DRAFT_188204 [Lentinula aciculospora]
MPLTVPLELHELVIDVLGLDHSFTALKACSLVCKAWLSRSRLHLFRILLIRPRVFNKGYSDPFYYEYQQCFSLNHQAISSYVRDLKLFYEPQNTFRSLLSPTNPSCVPISSALIPVSSMITIPFPFNRLQSLHLCWKTVNLGGITAFEKMLQQIDCLRHLVIEGCWRFRAKEDVIASIAVHAPNIRTLCLSKFHWIPNSFASPFVEEILDRWNNRFLEKGVPPLPLERLYITQSDSTAILAKVVVLLSPCLDLRNLRYLAMPISSLLGALADTRFRTLGKQVTHLAIVNLDRSVFQLPADSFPNLSHLQLYVRQDRILLRFLRNIQIPGASAISTPHLVHMHINFETHQNLIPNNEEMSAQQCNDMLARASHIDSALHEFIVNRRVGIQVSMHFAQVEAEVQCNYIQEVFPRSIFTGCLDWMGSESFKWWFDYE